MSDHAHEIVIIKRHHGDHDDHHGGVWKIAFADFMTAMMAFFLVMWLISANDKTKASVARYFNPVKLVDATTQPRGMHDTTETTSVSPSPDGKDPNPKDQPKSGGPPKPAAVDKKGETSTGRETRLDTALRESPYVALAEIAGTKGPGEVATPVTNAAPPAIGRRGGDSFRDPFAPPTTSAQPDVDDADIAKLVTDKPETNSDDAAAAKAAKDAKAAKEALEKKRQDDLKAQLLATVKSMSREAGPSIDVRATDEGLLVSLIDNDSFSMFSNGSAVPSRRVVLLMDRVAQLLKTRPGEIVLRGYTDNKQFHSSRYDNWHLSLDRAQVTHYMLVRGGVSDARIGHVEGYADRVTKSGVDPSSPLNRRIEILLKDKA
jgi:chemotaxis protein MotB